MEGQNGKSRQGIRQEASWRAPMVSIIVPVYNVEAYLADCVGSIYAQTFEDYELLLMDDASTDGSGRLADELASRDPRARVVHHKTNQGHGTAGPVRNRGIRESIGKYIAFIDGDDWVEPDYLALLVAAAERNHADVVRVGAEKYYRKEDGEWRIEPNDAIVSKEAVLTSDRKQRMVLMSMYRIPMTIWGCVITRDLFVRTNFQFEAVYNDDTLFLIFLLHAAGRYVMLPRRGYCYRQIASSIVHKKSLEKSRKALEFTLHGLACVERALREWEEFQGDDVLCDKVRTWYVDVLLRNSWLRISEGLDGKAVLAEASKVFLEMAPQQTALLNYLLAAWIRQFTKHG